MAINNTNNIGHKWYKKHSYGQKKEAIIGNLLAMNVHL